MVSRLLALVDPDIIAGRRAGVELARTANLLLRILNHLTPLAVQPTVRATANSTVNIEVGKPIAFRVMPE